MTGQPSDPPEEETANKAACPIPSDPDIQSALEERSRKYRARSRQQSEPSPPPSSQQDLPESTDPESPRHHDHVVNQALIHASRVKENLQTGVQTGVLNAQEFAASARENANELMTTVQSGVPTNWEGYCALVRTNRFWIRPLENLLRYTPYFVMSSDPDHRIQAEGVYSLASWAMTVNDRALDEESNPSVYGGRDTTMIKNVKSAIAMAQHGEVLAELIAARHVSWRKKWKLILAIETIKSMLRLILLHNRKGRILFMPSDEEVQQLRQLEEIENSESNWKGLKKMFLEHGRGVTPNGFFSDETQHLQNSLAASLQDRPAEVNEIIGEAIYLIRPVLYLLSFLKFNKTSKDRSWQPFLVAIGLDILSQFLYLYKNPTPLQVRELERRRRQWIWYLLHQPAFDLFLKGNMDRIIALFSNYTLLRPLKAILNMLKEYVEDYQSIYFSTTTSSY